MIESYLRRKLTLAQIILEHNEILEHPVGLGEVFTATDLLKDDKSLGPDGYTLEFY